MSRRPSETIEMHKPTNLEKNCQQIFTKGPALTRDILQKMKNDKREIMGYEIETRQLWVLSGLLLLFLLSLSGMIAMWFTDTFDNAVFSNLALTPNGQSFEMWKKPTPKPLIKVHIFNYTNVPEYETKDAEKLNVKELGPYVYEVTLERHNTRFNGSSISYQERRAYKFLPELSKGRQNDRVVVPNIPLLSAAAVSRHANFLQRMSLSGLLNGLNANAFMTIPAHRFMMGYEDNLYSLSKSYMTFQNQKPYERFGLLVSSLGLLDDVFTVNSGKTDINKIGVYEKFNGQSRLSQWSTDECNDITTSTDGTFFPPKLIRNKRPISFFYKDFCRPFPMHFQKEVKIFNGSVPAYRYVVPDNLYDTPEKTPANQCYCDMDLGECPPQGVLNITACAFGAPFFLSHPHFYNADPILKEGVTGLNPNPEYQTYSDLHPTLGYVMTGKMRSQINVQVKKSFGISQVNMFDNDLMLPVAWIDLSLEEKRLPQDMVGIIFLTSFTLKSVELGLRYGCLLTVGVTLFCIIMVLKNRWNEKVRGSSIKSLREERV